MKYALIIPDGAADEPQHTLDGKTPFDFAKTPHMDEVARLGVVGQADNVPGDMPSGSDVGTMSLFGYSPLKFHTGRAPLEAAAQGIALGPHDWAIRCNLITSLDGMMTSFTAGQIPNDLAAELITAMQTLVKDDPRWTFYTGVSYRNLLVYRGKEGEQSPFDATTKTEPPHDVTDKAVQPYLPKGKGGQLLLDLMERSKALFASHAGNQARKANNEQPATQVWLWGQGSKPAFQPFEERFGVKSAVITAVDLLRGIGRLLGWDVVNVPGATGYLDTDYAAKGRYAIETLKSGKDFVVVHVEASDEASHEGDVEAKVHALEQIDAKIVGPVHEYLKSQGEYRILISPDHPTFLRTKTHSHGYVPFTMAGSGIEADEATHYHEGAAAGTGLTFDAGWELMPTFFGKPGA